MSLVLGVDQSLNHTGVCLMNYQGAVVILQLIEPKLKLSTAKKLVYIRDSIYSICQDKPITKIVIEGYSHGSMGRKYDLGAVAGILRMLSVDLDVTLVEVAPKQRAKFATGKGSATKEEVKAFVQQKWGTEIGDDNLADAYVLARIGYELEVKLTQVRHELDVLKKLTSTDLKGPSLSAIKSVPDSL